MLEFCEVEVGCAPIRPTTSFFDSGDFGDFEERKAM